MYNIYLFDFDYTLADSHRGIVMCFRHVLNTHGIENISDEAIKKTIGLTLIDAFRVLTGSEDKELLTRYKEEYMIKADEVMTKNTILYKETIPMFKRLKRAGHRVGIISTKLRYRIEQTLETYGLEGFVDLIIGGEDVEEAKPNPQGIYKAIDYFKGIKEEVLYVGDSYIDAEAARNAGVAFMGVTTGTTTREDFLAYPHIKIMDTLDEVASIHNKKVLMFLAKGFETMEFSPFVDILGWARNDYGIDVELTTCGFTHKVISSFNIPVLVDQIIDNIKVEDYDALAIPGGFEEYGFYEEAYDEKLLEIIREFDKQGKMIATICVGALPVAKSGVLRGRKATTYHLREGYRQRQLSTFGVQVVNEPIVVDKNIITSYSPQTAAEVGFRLLEGMTSTEDMNVVKEGMGY